MDTRRNRSSERTFFAKAALRKKGAMPSVPLFTARGRFHSSSEGGETIHRLKVGDNFPLQIADAVARVVIEVHDCRLEVTLALRADDLSAVNWADVDHLPLPFALLVKPPFAWFMMDFHGQHYGAAFALNRDVALAAAIRQNLLNPDACRSVVLYGIEGHVVRIIKAGIRTDDLWPMLLAGLDATPTDLGTERYLAELNTMVGAKQGPRMFAEAMRRLFQP